MNVAMFILSLLQTIAIIAGGGWALHKFGLFRESVPRGNITHQVSHRYLNEYAVHLSVHVVFTNIGRVVWHLRPKDGFTRIQQIKPIALDELLKFQQNIDDGVETEYQWPEIGRGEFQPDISFSIEPQDNEKIYYEFVFPTPMDTILINSYYPSDNDGEEPKGLAAVTVYDITPIAEEPPNTRENHVVI